MYNLKINIKRMKQNLLLFTILLSMSGLAQKSDRKNALNLHFGSGTLFSVDYERIWRNTKNPNLIIASVGGGVAMKGMVWKFYNKSPGSIDYFVAPHRITTAVGNGRNYLEVGFGGIYVHGNTTQPYLAYPLVGYRYFGSNRSTFKVYLSWPVTGIKTDDLHFIPFGVSFGQLF
jgi:hypothetical protein